MADKALTKKIEDMLNALIDFQKAHPDGVSYTIDAIPTPVLEKYQRQITQLQARIYELEDEVKQGDADYLSLQDKTDNFRVENQRLREALEDWRQQAVDYEDTGNIEFIDKALEVDGE